MSGGGGSCSARRAIVFRADSNESQNENFPCRFIPLNEKGETIDCFYRCGTQLEMEEALAGWLHSQITRIEQRLATPAGPLPQECDELSKLAET